MAKPITRKPLESDAKKEEDKTVTAIVADVVGDVNTAATTDASDGAGPLIETIAKPETRGNVDAVIEDHTDKAALEEAKRVEEARVADEAQAAEMRRAEAAQAEAAKVAANDAAASADESFVFLSRMPELTVYVKCGETATGRGGVHVEIESRLQFRNGVFTASATQSKALREHKRFNNFFREGATDGEATMRRALARRQDQMQTGVVTGTTASDAGNEQRFLNESTNLQAAERKLVDL